MIDLTIPTQPDDENCGVACLHAVYNYYGLTVGLSDLLEQIDPFYFPSGGTRAPFLGKHALQQGFEAIIYINNLDLFDPSWFKQGKAAPSLLIDKLTNQLNYKNDKAPLQLSIAYLNYLRLGGQIRFQTLNSHLLKPYFNQGIPIITALSATYLYGCARERYTDDGVAVYDDEYGMPRGHFVVLCGYDQKKKHVVIADPHRENPLSQDHYYKVSIFRLINAILLGILTHDGTLLIIQPKRM